MLRVFDSFGVGNFAGAIQYRVFTTKRVCFTDGLHRTGFFSSTFVSMLASVIRVLNVDGRWKNGVPFHRNIGIVCKHVFVVLTTKHTIIPTVVLAYSTNITHNLLKNILKYVCRFCHRHCRSRSVLPFFLFEVCDMSHVVNTDIKIMLFV